MELAFAGLHQLCVPLLGRLEQLPRPQRDALAVAFGMREAGSGSFPGRPGGVEPAGRDGGGPAAGLRGGRRAVADRASVQCLAFAARRLLAEPIA